MNFSFLRHSKSFSDFLFVLWAGGAALLSYSLVYALRKPFTAAVFDGLTLWGTDYKVMVTVFQISGYLLAKFLGIKFISELKKECRFRFILGAVLLAESALLGFALLPVPYNILAMFFNGLALGCMWGVVFSYIEGRRITDLLASLLGISMVISSGMAKSLGLFVMDSLGVSEFWMPALIGGCALPFLVLLGYALQCLPPPSVRDKACRSERTPLDGAGRRRLFKAYLPFLSAVLLANFLLVALRDIKEDFLVNIFDAAANGYSSWLFARLDSVVTLLILAVFALTVFIRNNRQALLVLLGLVIGSVAVMAFISLRYESLQLNAVLWLFTQSLCLYIAYLCFQTVFFDRFIACFRIQGNAGFFIVLIDSVGYTGTVVVLVLKEFFTPDTDWLYFYNQFAGYTGIGCCVLFSGAFVYLWRQMGRKAVKDFCPAGAY